MLGFSFSIAFSFSVIRNSTGCILRQKTGFSEPIQIYTENNTHNHLTIGIIEQNSYSGISYRWPELSKVTIFSLQNVSPPLVIKIDKKFIVFIAHKKRARNTKVSFVY